MTRGKRYDEDFKKMIVELYTDQNKPASEIEREYGVSNASIYKWIEEYSPMLIVNIK